MHKCDRLIEIRAAFLACGSLAAGAHGYHLEFVLPDGETAERLQWMLRSTGRHPKTTRRKTRRRPVLQGFRCDRGGAHALIGAFGAVLHLEDVRALRETKNRIHRLVNTEAANLERAAAAAAVQRRTIEYSAQRLRARALSPALREIAELRLAHPDESLAELGPALQSADRQADGRRAGSRRSARLAEQAARRQGQRDKRAR